MLVFTQPLCRELLEKIGESERAHSTTAFDHGGGGGLEDTRSLTRLAPPDPRAQTI